MGFKVTAATAPTQFCFAFERRWGFSKTSATAVVGKKNLRRSFGGRHCHLSLGATMKKGPFLGGGRKINNRVPNVGGAPIGRRTNFRTNNNNNKNKISSATAAGVVVVNGAGPGGTVGATRAPRQRKGGQEKSNRRAVPPGITAKRVTLPLGFLSYGAKSETARKTCKIIRRSEEDDIARFHANSEQAQNVLAENLHGLLGATATAEQQQNPFSQFTQVRRSQRLSKRKPAAGTKQTADLTASTYYLHVIAGPKPAKNSSKSLFKEIRRRYAEQQQLQIQQRAESAAAWVNNSSEASRASFSETVIQQTNPINAARSETPHSRNQEKIIEFSLCDKRPSFIRLRDSNYFRQKITNQIDLVNDIFSGKITTAGSTSNSNFITMSSGNKDPGFFMSSEDKENLMPLQQKHLLQIPKSQWVFRTPPNRKLNIKHMQATQRKFNACGGTIKPAVIQHVTTNQNERKQVVYEMDGRINVDLTRFSDKQEIAIDKRYMIEVTNNNTTSSGGACCSSSAMDVGGGDDSSIGTFSGNEEAQKMDLEGGGEPFELENHFLSLTCRPKKRNYSYSRLRGGSNNKPLVATVSRSRSNFPNFGCVSTTTTSTSTSTPVGGHSIANENDPNFDRNNETFAYLKNMPLLEESFTFEFTTPTGSVDGVCNTTGHMFDLQGNKKETFDFRYETWDS